MIVIQNTKKEIVGVFNEKDEYVKSASRKEIREHNLIHRATNIFVINKEGKILVQTRSMTKEYCPGYLDLVIGGVVGDKEDVELSAKREVGEEIGIEIEKIKDKMIYLGKTYYSDSICKTWGYNYIIHLTKEEESMITFRDNEVSKVDWYSKEEIVKMIDEKNIKITGDSILAFNTYIVGNNNI